MKQIYSAKTGLEAHERKLFLQSEGISAFVFGDNNSFEVGFALTPATEPGVYVEAVDAERASKLLQEYHAKQHPQSPRGSWKCKNCGESGGESFDLCWKCESPRPPDLQPSVPDACTTIERLDESPAKDVPAALAATAEEDREPRTSATGASPSPPTDQQWLDVLLVLALTQPLLGGYVLSTFLNDAWPQGTFTSQSTFTIVLEMATVALVLLLMWRSGQRWSTFGLYRPRLLWDWFGAGILYLFTVRAVAVSNGIFVDALQEWLPSDTYHRLMNLPSDWIPPSGANDLPITIAVCLAIGLSEELVYRGFLIPRFERLLGSTSISVVLTAILFAVNHYVGGGVLGVWNALGFGIIFGCVFAYFRRLWPLVFAHALADFVVFLRS